MTDSAAIVSEFLDHLAVPDAAAAISLLHPDIEWRNTGMPTIRGKRVGSMLHDLEKGKIGFAVRMHHIAQDGDVVLTDRTDILTIGPVATEFWVCGTFVVRDGLIVVWDDHFSWANFTKGIAVGLVRAVRPAIRDLAQ